SLRVPPSPACTARGDGDAGQGPRWWPGQWVAVGAGVRVGVPPGCTVTVKDTLQRVPFPPGAAGQVPWTVHSAPEPPGAERASGASDRASHATSGASGISGNAPSGSSAPIGSASGRGTAG